MKINVAPLTDEIKKDTIEKMYKIIDQWLVYFNQIKKKPSCQEWLVMLWRVFYHEPWMKEIRKEFTKLNRDIIKKESEQKFYGRFKKFEIEITKKHNNSYHILEKYTIVDEWEKVNAMTIGVPYVDNKDNHFGWTIIIREDDYPGIYKEFEKTLSLI